MAENEEKRVTSARLKFTRIAPRKMRLVVDVIRGKPAEEALLALRFCRRGGAPAVTKLLRSAIA
ncbi:MAG: 50S ribosomal protein L22, partial [Candidatus Methylomirabilis sp.]|nr:50S ribosomal protein L22 [Deltaproteobacteria bacterium]